MHQTCDLFLSKQKLTQMQRSCIQHRLDIDLYTHPTDLYRIVEKSCQMEALHQWRSAQSMLQIEERERDGSKRGFVSIVEKSLAKKQKLHHVNQLLMLIHLKLFFCNKNELALFS